MKYINTKTGVVIETDSILRGVWKEYNPSETSTKDAVEETEVEEVIEKVKKNKDKTKINADDFDKVTIADIKKELDAFGIEYNPKAKKKELWDLMFEGR